MMYRRDKLLSPTKLGADLGKKCCAKHCLAAFSVNQLQEERARFISNVREDHNNLIVQRLNALKVVEAPKGAEGEKSIRYEQVRSN